MCEKYAKKGFSCSHWIVGNSVGTLVPLAWVVLDSEEIPERPANTMYQPSGQHTGVFLVGHVQCYCNSRILSLSGARQVTLLASKVVMPFYNNLLGLVKCFLETLVPNKLCILFDKI